MQVLKENEDFFTSVVKSLTEIDENWMNYKGYLLVGSHLPKNVDEKLQKLKEAREQGVPTLGLCMGMQYMCIEYMRNVWGVLEASSTEIDPHTILPVIKAMPKMRVGIFPVEARMESHWHNYMFNLDYSQLFSKDWNLTFTDNILEIMRLKEHPHYVGVQFHPEYQSSKDNPHPILFNFIQACKQYAAVGLPR